MCTMCPMPGMRSDRPPGAGSPPVSSRRPLTSSTADQALFIDRDRETSAIISAIEMGLNTFVTGTAGSGKTSLLRHIARALEQARRTVRYVNVEAAESVTEAIALIARAIDPTVPDTPAMVDDETDLAVIERTADGRPLVLLIDGATDQVNTVLFGRYRDQLWESPNLTWVTASRQAAPPAPADAFFDRVLELAPLTATAGAMLLERRAPQIAADVRAHLVAAIGSAQPLFWMLAAQTLALTPDSPQEIIDALAQQRVATEQLPDRLRALHQAIVDLGPVHAGDSELLDRLGAARPSVVAGLKQLERQGLVRSERDGRRVQYESAHRHLTRGLAHPDPPLEGGRV